MRAEEGTSKRRLYDPNQKRENLLALSFAFLSFSPPFLKNLRSAKKIVKHFIAGRDTKENADRFRPLTSK
jgi:hypothetical protein